jgi:hypothetical protein
VYFLHSVHTKVKLATTSTCHLFSCSLSFTVDGLTLFLLIRELSISNVGPDVDYPE